MNPVPVAWLIVALALSGCASSMSGVGGTDSSACKAPEGALCTSVSGVYANSVYGSPQPAKPSATKPTVAAPAIYGAASIAPGNPTASVTPGNAIRSNPRLLRVWIAPWEDSDGDLHEQAFIHIIVDTGRWLIEHARPAGRSRVDGVAPPVSPGQDAAVKGPSDTPSPAGRLPLAPGALPPGVETTPIER